MQLPQPPVNKFPQFTGHVVRRLKTLCPSMGKVKIAQMLARAGLHLGTTTVGRMLKGGKSRGSTRFLDPEPDTAHPAGAERMPPASRQADGWSRPSGRTTCGTSI